MRGDLLALEVMRIYGWDWFTYLSQPSWLIDLAVEKMIIDKKLGRKF